MSLPTSRNTTYAALSQVLAADLNDLQDFVVAVLGVVAGGRLTLTTAVPVTTSDVTGATTVRYAPYKHNRVLLYNGTRWMPHVFTELSQATSDASKSPFAVANNSNYDVFVWSDSGTVRATRGPAWTSDTGRGTGAATTELEMLDGRLVNKIAITNGPAAQRGLYVGTVRSDGSAQINDSAAKRHVWNNYNRVLRSMRVLEGTDTWNYTTNTFRQANASAANQISVVRGLDEDAMRAHVCGYASNSDASGIGVAVAIGLDSTTTCHANTIAAPVHVMLTMAAQGPSAAWSGLPGLGLHDLVWLEKSGATGTTTWSGDAGGAAGVQSGIIGEGLA